MRKGQHAWQVSYQNIRGESREPSQGLERNVCHLVVTFAHSSLRLYMERKDNGPKDERVPAADVMPYIFIYTTSPPQSIMEHSILASAALD